MIKKVALSIYNFVYNNVVPLFGRFFVSKNKYCNVIYYHDVVQDCGGSCMYINVDKFKMQMRHLKSMGFEFMRFDDFEYNDKVKFQKKRLLIAFDDGWLSNYTEIFEFMRSEKIKYNVFLTIGEIGVNKNYLTWEMVREMHQSGIVGFGTHTYTHPDMSDLERIDWRLEIEESDNRFFRELGYEPHDFCYPFGYFSEDSITRLISESAYLRIYLSESMFSYEQDGKIVFGRTGIKGENSISDLMKAANGYKNLNYLYTRWFHTPVLAVYHLFHKPSIEKKR